MFFVNNQLERNLVDAKSRAVDIPAAVSTEVIPDSIAKNAEYASIEIFNAGADNAYYAFGRTCDNQYNFCAYLSPGQMLEVPVREAVNVYSVAGTKISITAIKRRQQEVNIRFPV